MQHLGPLGSCFLGARCSPCSLLTHLALCCRRNCSARLPWALQIKRGREWLPPQEAPLVCFIWMEIKHRNFFPLCLAGFQCILTSSPGMCFSTLPRADLIPQGSSPTFQPICPHPDAARTWACAAGFDIQLLCLLLPPSVLFYLFYSI